jgi:hypothetical protein
MKHVISINIVIRWKYTFVTRTSMLEIKVHIEWKQVLFKKKSVHDCIFYLYLLIN